MCALKKSGAGITRRGFLKCAGVAAGTLVLPKTLYAMGGSTQSLNVGVLLPSSTIYPEMAKNFMDGMGLRSGIGTALGILPGDIGMGQSGALKKSTELLDSGRIDIVVALAHPGVASSLYPLFESSGTPLVVSNVGECVPRKGEQSPAAFHCTLHFWQANWAMGRWAARNLGKTAFIASSFYDSGYDMASAFRFGFESAGGSVLETSVSHLSPESDRPSWQVSRIKVSRPDFVYALYSGKQAVEFVQAYAASGLSRTTPLAGPSFLVDDAILPVQGAAAAGIRTCLPWTSDLASRENSEFLAAYRHKTGRMPDTFALLGYDTAGLIHKAMETARGMGGLKEALRNAHFSSPRGSLTMDPSRASVDGPLYMSEVRLVGGSPFKSVIGEIPAVPETSEAVKPIHLAVRTGWHNAYLCV